MPWIPTPALSSAIEAPLAPIELPPQMPPEAPKSLVNDEKLKVVSSTTVKEMIETEAKLAGVDPALMVRVAKCESGLNPKAKNPVGTASGIYQYLDSTFRTYCINEYGLATSSKQKNDPLVQIQCAVKMVKAGGISHWSESSYCHWGG